MSNMELVFVLVGLIIVAPTLIDIIQELTKDQ
jgi:hypothetical protein